MIKVIIFKIFSYLIVFINYKLFICLFGVFINSPYFLSAPRTTYFKCDEYIQSFKSFTKHVNNHESGRKLSDFGGLLPKYSGFLKA